jgi:hypothetical protein
MNSPKINFTKVQSAVAKYVPKATLTKKEKQPPVDAAIRKPLKGRTIKCVGFEHPHFLNNDR